MSLALLLSRFTLFAVLTDLETVRTAMNTYAIWLIALPLVAAPSYLLDGIFIGSARTRAMMWTMLVSALLVYLPAWWLSRDLGNHGLWLAFTLFNGARGLTLWVCYRYNTRHGKWLETGA